MRVGVRGSAAWLMLLLRNDYHLACLPLFLTKSRCILVYLG